MPKEASTNFEIPAEMRNFAEKSLQQAKQAFDSFITATQEAVNTVESRAVHARSGAKDVVDLAMHFAERNTAASFEFAQRLVNAKDAKEATAIHADYVRTQIATLTDQAKELSKQTSKMAGRQH